MGIFLVYILKSALCLAAFYLFYRLLLSRETLHRFNRAVLLGVLALSAVVPLIEVSTEQPSGVGQGMMSLEQWLAMAETMADASPVVVEQSRSVWPLALLAVYALGVLVFFGRNVCSLFRLGQLLRGTRREDIRRYVPDASGVLLLVHDRPVAPFSWMRCIVVSRKDLEEDARPILLHELAHIRSGHSWDLLLADLCCFVQWFNPAAWLLKQELQTVHEYEADEAVLGAGVNAKEYQLLLIKKAVGTRLYSMANSLNHSKLKKRITMMMKEKSSKWACAKCLYVLPLAAVAVAAFARPELSGVSNELSAAKVTDLAAVVKENVVEKTSVLTQEAAPAVPAVAEIPASADTVIQVPEFPGGQEALRKYLAKNRRSPLVDTRSGTVIVSFVIDEEGRVTQPKINKGIAEAFDAEAIRLVNEMPRWKPMTKNGKPVASTYVVYVDFPSALAEQNATPQPKEHPLVVVDGKPMPYETFEQEVKLAEIASITILKGDDAAVYGTRWAKTGVMIVTTKSAGQPDNGLKGKVAGVYDMVEQAPQFPGGPQAMMQFVKDNLQYPQAAKENGIQGRVILQFVVDETGQVTDPKVLRGIDPSLDAEAIRIAKAMPRWVPGAKDGKAVAVRYTMPVAFSLNEDGQLPQKKNLWVIDGKIASYEEVKALPSSDIVDMKILKDEQAVRKYGEQAKDGAIEVTTKAAAEAQGLMRVEGTVADEKGEPVMGAIVRLSDDEKTGVVTDTKGYFSLLAPEGSRIECMYVGFQTARVDAQPKVTITLKAE